MIARTKPWVIAALVVALFSSSVFSVPSIGQGGATRRRRNGNNAEVPDRFDADKESLVREQLRHYSKQNRLPPTPSRKIAYLQSFLERRERRRVQTASDIIYSVVKPASSTSSYARSDVIKFAANARKGGTNGGKGGKGSKSSKVSSGKGSKQGTSSPVPSGSFSPTPSATASSFSPNPSATGSSPPAPVVTSKSSKSKSSKSKSSKSSGKSSRKKKGNRLCTNFEFDERRRLQFEGEDCTPNVLDAARENPELTIFVDLVARAGLEDIFECAGPFTLLPPTNSAFAALDPDLLAELVLEENQEELEELLLYHIIPGVVLSDDFEDGEIEALSGDDIRVSVNPLEFNGGATVTTDIMGCNGVLQVIAQVLIPGDADFCEAFDFDDDSNDNCTPNVLQEAAANPDLSTVVTLIESAGLDDVFDCSGPFTLLLPNNAAFDKLGDALIEALGDPANVDVLSDLLSYHVLPGAFPSNELEAGALDTLLGGALVTVTLDPIMFDDAGVVTADNTACNGLFHIIDDVLIPAAPSPPPTTISPSPQPTAISSAGLPTALPSTNIGAPTMLPTVERLDCSEFNFGGGTAGCTPNILEVATDNLELDLSLIVSLYEVGGLTQIFSCPGLFTANFPTNEAFTNFDLDRLEFLLQPENLAELQEVLLYHLLPGQTMAGDFEAGPASTLLTEQSVEITVSPIMFDDAAVEMADISSCNGLINTIDTVLDPATTATLAPSVATLAPSLATPMVTESPTGSPTNTNGGSITIDSFYFAYVSNSNVEPTEAEYAQLRDDTEAYYDELFTLKYSDNADVDFTGIAMNLNFTESGLGFPEPRFNIYLEFANAVVDFLGSGSIPTADELFFTIKEGLTTDFLLNVVRTIDNSPFTQVVEAVVDEL